LNTTTTAQTVSNFLTGIASGSAQDGQNLTFSVTNDNPDLFTTVPAFTGSNTNRNLTYRVNGTPGLANVRVVVKDNGGTLDGGIDSTVKQFVFSVCKFPTVNLQQRFQNISKSCK
jgi:hypothetical protein